MPLGAYSEISTSASISTGMSNGNSAMPTALREWAPISGPNSSSLAVAQHLRWLAQPVRFGTDRNH